MIESGKLQIYALALEGYHQTQTMPCEKEYHIVVQVCELRCVFACKGLDRTTSCLVGSIFLGHGE